MAPSDKAALLDDAMPEFAEELRSLMLTATRADLAAQVGHLRIVNRCRCGDDSCATFHTRPKPAGAWGSGLETIPLDPAHGMVNVDVLHGSIVSIEVLNREDVKATLAKAMP